MPSFTVLDVQRKRDYNDRYGPKAAYILTLDDGSGGGLIEAEVSQLPETPEPKKGPIEGDLTNSDYGWKFKKTRTQTSAPASAGNAKVKGEPYRKHPAEVAAVQRAHAQHMALMQLAIESKLEGFRFPPGPSMETRVDWWENDVLRAMKAAELGNQAPGSPQSPVEAVRPPDGDPAMETREEMEERVRAEVLAANAPLRRMP